MKLRQELGAMTKECPSEPLDKGGGHSRGDDPGQGETKLHGAGHITEEKNIHGGSAEKDNMQ